MKTLVSRSTSSVSSSSLSTYSDSTLSQRSDQIRYHSSNLTFDVFGIVDKILIIAYLVLVVTVVILLLLILSSKHGTAQLSYAIQQSIVGALSCLLIPCQNQGYCTPQRAVTGERWWYCECIGTFVGRYCETENNPCLGYSCPGDATCIVTNYSLTCVQTSNLSNSTASYTKIHSVTVANSNGLLNLTLQNTTTFSSPVCSTPTLTKVCYANTVGNIAVGTQFSDSQMFSQCGFITGWRVTYTEGTVLSLQFLYGSVDVGWAPLRGISQSSASYASMVLPKGRYLSVIFICNQLSPFYIESIQFGTVTPYPGSSISYGPYGICTGTSVSHYVDGVGYMSGTVDSVTNKIMGLVLNKMC